MMQKEVAQRLTANIGTKEYSRISVVVGAYLDIAIRGRRRHDDIQKTICYLYHATTSLKVNANTE